LNIYKAARRLNGSESPVRRLIDAASCPRFASAVLSGSTQRRSCGRMLASALKLRPSSRPQHSVASLWPPWPAGRPAGRMAGWTSSARTSAPHGRAPEEAVQAKRIESYVETVRKRLWGEQW